MFLGFDFSEDGQRRTAAPVESGFVRLLSRRPAGSARAGRASKTADGEQQESLVFQIERNGFN